MQCTRCVPRHTNNFRLAKDLNLTAHFVGQNFKFISFTDRGISHIDVVGREMKLLTNSDHRQNESTACVSIGLLTVFRIFSGFS